MGAACEPCADAIFGVEVTETDRTSIYYQLYCAAAGPIPTMQIRDFMYDIEQTKVLCWHSEGRFEDSFIEDEVDYDQFIGVLRQNSRWSAYLGEDSNLIKLLNLGKVDEKPGFFLVTDGRTLRNSVSLMQIKILGLLLCDGCEVAKADMLFDVMYGPGILNRGYHYPGRDDDKIAWKNPRLIEIVRKLIYYSEVFPKHYLETFIPDTSHLFDHAACESEAEEFSFRSERSDVLVGADENPTQVKNQPQEPSIQCMESDEDLAVAKKDNDENDINEGEIPASDRDGDGKVAPQESEPHHTCMSWRPALRQTQLQYIEDHFDRIFMEIYEEKFIDDIFEPFKSTITRKAFRKAVDRKHLGGGFEMPHLDGVYNHELQGTAHWLFNPPDIRRIFKEHLAALREREGISTEI